MLLFEVHYDEHDSDASGQDKPDIPSTQVTSVSVCACACMFDLFFSTYCQFGISFWVTFFLRNVPFSRLSIYVQIIRLAVCLLASGRDKLMSVCVRAHAYAQTAAV